MAGASLRFTILSCHPTYDNPHLTPMIIALGSPRPPTSVDGELYYVQIREKRNGKRGERCMASQYDTYQVLSMLISYRTFATPTLPSFLPSFNCACYPNRRSGTTPSLRPYLPFPLRSSSLGSLLAFYRALQRAEPMNRTELR